MSIRIFGILILLLSAVRYSFVMVKREKQKIAQLEDICALVLYVQRNIEGFMTPVNEIVQSFEEYSESFSDYMVLAKNHGLNYALEHYPMLQKAEIMKVFANFTKKIGRGYKEEELSLCQYTYTLLTEALSKEKDDFSKKTKMYKTLPIMSAISLALILY